MASSPTSASPAASPSASPATSTAKDDHTAPTSDAPEVMTLDDSDSDDQLAPAKADNDGDSEMVDAQDGEEKGTKAGKGTKRKGTDTPTSRPSKSAKATSSSTPSSSKPSKKKKDAEASTSTPKTPAGGEDKEKKLVELNLKTCKFDVKQKALKVDMTQSYRKELADFVDFAVKLYQEDKDAVLDDYPEEQHGIIAKLIHEATTTLNVLAKNIKSTLSMAVSVQLQALEDESQEDSQEDASGPDVDKLLPLAPLKSLINSLATRTNYGLQYDEIEDHDTNLLDDNAKDVPPHTQIWAWEVKDLGLLCSEFQARWEKRRAEREQIRSDALELFLALSSEQQHAVLNKQGSKTASSSTPADKKGKGKAKASPEAEGDEAKDGESKDKKEKAAKPKKEKKVKELTDEQRKEQEEKAAKKAEREAEKAKKDAEKEDKRKEREEKKALKDAEKAEKEAAKAEKERVKREKEEEEQKKLQAKKKQSSMFTNFFTKTSPVPSDAGPSKSTTPVASTSASASTSAAGSANGTTPSKPSKPSKNGFDYVFHPFTIRPNVEMARVTRDSVREGKEVAIQVEGEQGKDALLADMKSRLKRSHVLRTNHYPDPPVCVREAHAHINDAALTEYDASEYERLLQDRKQVPIKLLKFAEDVRPGYIGTWTKTSRVVGFRTPFARESALLNYDYDSEAEWEPEGDDGDDLANSDPEGEDDAPDSDADSWLAEDDEVEYEEGYDAEGDVVMLEAEGRAAKSDDDVIIIDDEAEKLRKKRAEKKRKDRGQQKRPKRAAPIQVIKGLAWEDDKGDSSEPLFKPMQMQFLNDASFGLNPFTFISKPFTASASSSSSAAAKGKNKENVALPATSNAAASPADPAKPTPAAVPTGTVNVLKPKRAPKAPFPAEHTARFVQFAHGSALKKPGLVDAFFEELKKDGITTTKGAIGDKYTELGFKYSKGQQIAKEEILVQHGIAIAP
ncbi:hypothetical protein JCM10213_002543 [Rhodosporidiobolus nylandii]